MSLLSEHSITCSKCGCSGIHACVGRVLPPPTPEDVARLENALRRVFFEETELSDLTLEVSSDL